MNESTTRLEPELPSPSRAFFLGHVAAMVVFAGIRIGAAVAEDLRALDKVSAEGLQLVGAAGFAALAIHFVRPLLSDGRVYLGYVMVAALVVLRHVIEVADEFDTWLFVTFPVALKIIEHLASIGAMLAFCGLFMYSVVRLNRTNDRLVLNERERRRAQEESRALQEQVQHAQKLESLGVLAGGIAHDFNNILTSIVGNLELAGRKRSLREAAPRLQAAMTAADRASDLTRLMLAYAGKAQVLREPVVLDGLLEETIRLLQAALPKNAEIVLEKGDIPLRIDGDRGQLRQVFMNLLTNAAESLGGTAGTITVRLGECRITDTDLRGSFLSALEPGPAVQVEVVDTGDGLSQGEIGRIFDPFYTTKEAGRGLGLSAVLGIVRDHGGAIFIDSAPGRGTSVRTCLPPACSGETTEETPRQAPREGRGRILVIDDEDFVREVAADSLRSQGYRVEEAEGGLEGLTKIESIGTELQAVLLDLTMKDLDGFEVLRRIREHNSELPVLVISGYSEHEFGSRISSDARADFLQKPFRPARLVERLEQLLQAPVN